MTDTKLSPIITFKTDNIKNQFGDVKLDSRLKFILYALAGYVYVNFGKAIHITEIYRTQEEQDAIYSNRPDYKEKPWLSVHQYWRGVDISTKYFTENEQSAINNYLSSNVIYNGQSELSTSLIHNVGMGNHLHVQVSPTEITVIRKI